jgi:hypothetical protein
VNVWGIKLSIRNLRSARMEKNGDLTVEFNDGEQIQRTIPALANIGLFDLAVTNAFLSKICQNHDTICC